MNYAQLKIIREWAVLQLQIAQTHTLDPIDRMSVTPENIHLSTGYKSMRQWLIRLSHRKRAKAVEWMQSYIVGVRELLARAKVTGEKLSLADLTIQIRDLETGEPIGGPVFGDHDDPQDVCAGAGEATMNLVANDENSRPYVKCPRCLQRWFAADVGFTVPRHEPIE